MSEKTIIEVNGVKLEVDLSNAKRIDEFRIGDNVKVLVKNYSSYESFPGVIVGFDAFKNLPTIIVCYCNISYSMAEIKFCYYNSESKDVELCHMHEHEKSIDVSDASATLEREVLKKEAELLELKRKRDYFISHYRKTFEQVSE